MGGLREEASDEVRSVLTGRIEATIRIESIKIKIR
jgi:hypothetical protein